MKERPIIFSAPMVRAILGGRKSQFRRIVKLPHMNPLGAWEPTTFGGPGLYLDKACTKPANAAERVGMWHTRTADIVVCPYGVPGDRLWVREAWRVFGGREYEYQQDRETVIYREGAELVDSVQGPWRPSIHMPRWASRITLEIVSVRVERVREINEADAWAEGVQIAARDFPLVGGETAPLGVGIRAYRSLWKSIHGADSWAANPWVWVIEFRRVA